MPLPFNYNTLSDMNKFFLLASISCLLTACDSGNILDKEISIQESGKVVKLTATINGISDWGGRYNVAVAAFSGDNQYALTQRAISENTADRTTVSIILSNLSSEVNTVELALTNKLRKRILTLASIDVDDFKADGDTIRMDLGTIHLDETGCIQQGIFTSACIQCHGANGRAAGNLNLTGDNLSECLVGVDAQSSVAGRGYKRIVAGDPENSLLYQILNPGGEAILHYNHTEVLSSQFKNNLSEVKALLYEWIGRIDN